MGVALRLYWEVARRGFQRTAAYPGATFGGLFTNTIFGFLRVYVLLALVGGAGMIVGGYDAGEAITYVWLTQGLGAVFNMWGRWTFVEHIRTGAITSDLSRPVDLQGWWLAQDLGGFAFRIVPRGIVPVLVGWVTFGINWPSSPTTWLAFFASVMLAELLSFAAAWAVALSTFWLLDANGVQMVYGLCASFFSGFILPVGMFPSVLRDVARVLPFASMLQVPIDVFLGEYEGAALVGALALQAFWVVVMVVVGRAVLGAATRRLVIQGG